MGGRAEHRELSHPGHSCTLSLSRPLAPEQGPEVLQLLLPESHLSVLDGRVDGGLSKAGRKDWGPVDLRDESQGSRRTVELSDRG